MQTLYVMRGPGCFWSIFFLIIQKKDNLLKFEEINKELAIALILQAVEDIKERPHRNIIQRNGKTYQYEQFTSKLTTREKREAKAFINSRELDLWVEGFDIKIDSSVIRKKIAQFCIENNGHKIK